MAAIGRVSGSTVGTNRDGDSPVRLLQVIISDPEDVQEVEQFGQSGEDFNPPNESNAIILDLGSAFRVVVGVDDGIEPTMGVGERKMYSIKDGTIKAFINLLSSGVIELNGNADYAVRFNELKTAFDQLKKDFDDAMSLGLNPHTHNDSLGAPTTAPLLPGPTWPAGVLPSTADIDPAKIEEIKVP